MSVLQSFFLKLLRSSWLKQHSQNSTRYTICKKRKLEVRPNAAIIDEVVLERKLPEKAANE